MTTDAVADDVAALVGRLFADKAGHEQGLAAENMPLLEELWKAVAGLGLPWVGVDETAGGSGGSIDDLLVILRASGEHAVPLPLLENHLAAWLVAAAGGTVATDRPWTVAPGTPADTLSVSGTRVSGALHDVAWGSAADRVVALLNEPDTGGVTLVVLDPADASVTVGRDIAGQPRDTLAFDGAEALVLDSPVTPEQLRQRGAVLRAVQMAGAMTAVYEVTKRYTGERHQFGRPIGTFQSVRTHLVHLAQMAVMTEVSAERAAHALESGHDASFDAYAAKLVADQNAAVSIRSAHQAHGAIGMTREYVLQDHTRRLNAWRGDWGTELALAERIGAAVLDAGRIATAATDAGSLVV